VKEGVGRRRGKEQQLLNARFFLLHLLKVHKNENFFASDFEFWTILLLVMF
jgi:hypothetical protein